MIRPKITPTLNNDGTIAVRVDWLEIAEGEQIRGVLFTEEFAFGHDAQAAGTGYVSRVAVDAADVRPGTFAVEEGGRRHFVCFAETGHLGITGQEI